MRPPLRRAKQRARRSDGLRAEACEKLDKPEYWELLADIALQYGNVDLVEIALQRTRDFDRLAFLCLLTGNVGKLNKMQAIAASADNMVSRFMIDLMINDVRDRTAVLAQFGFGASCGCREAASLLHRVLLTDGVSDGVCGAPLCRQAGSRCGADVRPDGGNGSVRRRGRECAATCYGCHSRQQLAAAERQQVYLLRSCCADFAE